MNAIIVSVSMLFMSAKSVVSFGQPRGIEESYSVKIQNCQHLLLVEQIGDVQKGSKNTTTFKVVDVLKSRGDKVKVGDRISLPERTQGKIGDQFTLMTNKQSAGWFLPGESDDVFWKYLKSLPEPVDTLEQQAERAAFFIPWLEHPHESIAQDAYRELEVLPYRMLLPLKNQLPIDKLRLWVSDPETYPVRGDLYPICLSICGDKEDLKQLKRIALENADFRRGVAGICFAIMVLEGEPGLQFLEQHKLVKKDVTAVDRERAKVSFSERYAALVAIRMAWQAELDDFSKERLQQSMHLLLDRPEFSDLVIFDLIRWEDWSIQDRLMKMYDDPDFDFSGVKRAIVRYMYQCSQQDTPRGSKPSPTAASASRHLKTLEEKDPKTYKSAMRFIVK